jgi:lysophospholipase L1-like esterase
MKNLRILLSLLAMTALLSACSEDTPIADPSLGGVNPQVYVAIGNSLTAGYQSGALFETGQKYSYPNLLAQQLGAGEFVQPLIPDPGTGNLMILQQLVPSPVITYNGNVLSAPSNVTHASPYNNLGIPGAILADAMDESDIVARGTSRANPFYSLIMRNQEVYGASLVKQALRLNPTLLSFWLGNNDVLGYATSGGVRGTNTGTGGFPPGTRPTEEARFQQILKGAFDLIQTSLPDTKVLVANIPNVMAVPFFTTVPRKIPNPTNPEQLLDIYYTTSSNTVGVVGPDDYVLLTAQAELGKGIGLHPSNPLPSQYVLDATEAQIAKNAVSSFNAILAAQAESHGFALVDCNRLLNDINANGYTIAGEEYTTAYITGGLFSLDGIHLSPRGNAIVANEFIATMNSAFGANIRQIPLHTFPGVMVGSGAGKRGAAVWSIDTKYDFQDLNWIFGAR